MKVVYGDLIEMAISGEFNVIVHGVNCQKKMASGVAKQVRETFPVVYDSYMHSNCLLGEIDGVAVSDNLTVINAYTQDRYGYDGRKYTSYDAIDSCFDLIHKLYGRKSIGIPLIGCDRGGGNWDVVKKIINQYELNITLVKYKRSK